MFWKCGGNVLQMYWICFVNVLFMVLLMVFVNVFCEWFANVF